MHACFCKNCVPSSDCLLKDYEATKKENIRIKKQNKKLQQQLKGLK